MCVNDILTFRTFVFSAASDTTIRQWDASTGNCLQIITAHETGVYGLYIDEDENLWSSSPDKYVKRWSLENFSNPECILEHPDSVKPMLVLPCGVLATGSRDEKIRIWNMANEKIIKELDGHYDEVSDLCIIEDKLYSGSYDGTLRFWLIKDALDPNVKFEYNVSDENIKPKVLKKLTEEEEEELNALMENDD
ncbi:hypothetical protein HMI54_000462 [Coelomomyces lativittatus]|nr:hypothetical protein HMI54_000462 [Coelomomyces lativittatus]